MTNGFLIVDKSAGWTSHDVVAKLRGVMGTRKVGHGGTLDPMATGVLIVGINRATRLLGYVADADKEYLATIRLGVSTITDDAQGDVVSTTSANHLDRHMIEVGMSGYRGTIDQVPSSVSAVKIQGKTAYKRVRAGEDVTLPPRTVTISAYELIDMRTTDDCVDVDVRVVCSSGTFIRALARDLGRDLNVGGHLTALRRTRVGAFGLENAQTLEQIEKSAHIIDMSDMARQLFPVLNVDAPTEALVRNGNRLPRGEISGKIAIFGPEGDFLAIYETAGDVVKPLAVFG